MWDVVSGVGDLAAGCEWEVICSGVAAAQRPKGPLAAAAFPTAPHALPPLRHRPLL